MANKFIVNLELVAARRASTARAADRPAWGWPSKGVEWEGKPGRTLFTVLIPVLCSGPAVETSSTLRRRVCKT